MTFIFVFAAAGLFASAPGPAAMTDACISTTLPVSRSDSQLERDVGQLLRLFVRSSLDQLDPQLEVTIYPPRGERYARYRGDGIGSRLVELGVAAHRIRVLETAEGDARYGPQPAGTLILSAGSAEDGDCGEDIGAAEP
jgi:type IV pilus biogenesis protein CpaD/CtpE